MGCVTKADEVPGRFRLLSWNLLNRSGARAGDVADLLRLHKPDVALFQEAWEDLDRLPSLIGGSYVRRTMKGRKHGPAAWSPHPFAVAEQLELPFAGNWDFPSPILKQPARRLALVVEVLGVRVAAVHLDHGQIANRRQFRHLVRSRPDVGVIAGDFNAIGPVLAPGFADVGPRAITHMAWGIMPLRLDRCLSRAMQCTSARALDRGRSDHRPILVDLAHAPHLQPLAEA